MLQEKYIDFLKKEVRKFFPQPEVEAFIFGSSVEKDFFCDVDVGLIGDFDRRKIYELKEELHDSTFPYFVDVVNVGRADQKFQNNVLSGKRVWL
jgi:predicted nucleotidyltransferase